MGRPLFQLDNRLALCAKYVRQDAALADIGTDHAYLPVWLARTGKIKCALACDLREEPLRHGQATIQKYHAEKLVKTRLSDGLQSISPDECGDIVIAGMGGEPIVRILSHAPWVRDPGKRLILQPMSKAEVLRSYLSNEGFAILQEEAVRSLGRIYSVMRCGYTGKKIQSGILDIYTGALQPGDRPLDREYIETVCRNLQKKANGLHAAGNETEAQPLFNLITALQKRAGIIKGGTD